MRQQATHPSRLARPTLRPTTVRATMEMASGQPLTGFSGECVCGVGGWVGG